VPYDPTIYLGSAEHYRYGRPAYSPELEAFLTRQAGLDGSGRLLARTRFGVPRQFFLPGLPDLLRDSESVLSGYFSFSYSAPHLFGDRLDRFAGEVRALLADRSAEGMFWDWPGDTEVVMARKLEAPSGGSIRGAVGRP
jgi:hypothetical protein